MKEWSIMTSFSELKIYSKYIGELRFGPAYIKIKNDPKNIFRDNLFGDWFCRVENGIFLQKWNSDPIKDGVHIKVNNDLVFYDIKENKIKTIEKGIKSFFWDIVKSSKNELI